jgi:hypothetical protein
MFPAGTEVCEFGNTASCIDSAAASPRSWGSAIAGYTIRSDGAWASVGTKIYGTGGNSNDKTLSIYDTVGNTWTTGPDAPFGLTFAAGGATSNQFFVVGQTPINTTVFIAFTPSMNAWAQLAMPPSGIYREYMPQWSNKLVAKTSSTLRTFDLTSMTWDPLPIPLPTGIGTSEAVVVVAGTPATLFIIGDDATSTMNIFKYNL